MNKSGKFSGIIICTDMDGTLLSSKGTVSDKNREAIEYFKANGGNFTFMTGRTTYGIKPFLDLPNMPVGINNGAGFFDNDMGKTIWNRYVNDSIYTLLGLVESEIPEAGIIVVTPDEVYYSSDNEFSLHHSHIGSDIHAQKHYSQIESKISKVIFTIHPDKIESLGKRLKEQDCADKFYFVRSYESFFEVLPKDTSKATLVEKLFEMTGIENIVCIGDNDNDVKMLEFAKVGVAVSNASEPAKRAADIITVSNNDSAIAKVISDIENGKIIF